VRVEAGHFVLGADLEFVAKLVEGESRFFFKAGAGGGSVGVNVSLDGSGAVGNDDVSVEGPIHIVFDFAAACEELLGLQVDGVFGDFGADDVANVFAEVCVKRGGPRGEGGV